MLSGLIEAVAGPPYNGKADLPVIARSLHMEVDDLFPVAETLQMLRAERWTIVKNSSSSSC